MLTVIAATDDSEQRTKLEARWRQSNRRARIDEMQYFCSSLDGVAIARTKLDVNPQLFNCANGTIYLPSGVLQSADRNDLITKISPVAYKPDALAPRFMQFLHELFPSNPDVIDLLQRLAGYSMTGETKDHVLILLYGREGRNGKTTLLEALLSVMGLKEYGTVTSASTFAVKRGGGIPNDLAKLALYRFVSVPEIDRTQSLNESLVKDVTGASTTTARFLYEEEFEFKPAFKIWMATNEMPKTTGGAPISARLVTIPFNVSFLGREDKELPGKLAQECEGILAWMVEGARLWYRDGLGALPSSVTGLRENYRSTMDALADFESRRLVFGEALRASYAALDDAYQAWCRDMGVAPLYGKSQLVAELLSRNLNLRRGKSDGARQLLGVGLKAAPRVGDGDSR